MLMVLSVSLLKSDCVRCSRLLFTSSKLVLITHVDGFLDLLVTQFPNL